MFSHRVRAVLGWSCGVVVVVLTAACSTPKATAVADAKTEPAPNPQLWGDMKPVVSVKELMRDMLDPLADNIFDAVAVVEEGGRTIERVPKTDADWARLQIGAVAMAEGAYLLKVRRPFAPPGDENNSTGPDAVELSPAAITAKIEKDPVEWNARIEALRNVGLEVIDIVKRKDVKELWDASENLDQACEACHRSYWYPGETPEYYRKLDRRLEDHREQSTTTGAPVRSERR